MSNFIYSEEEFNYYYEEEFVEVLNIYLLNEDWDNAYNILQDYLKYYSTKKSNRCNYLVNLILNLKNKGYEPKSDKFSFISFNIYGISLKIVLDKYTVTLSLQGKDNFFKITPFIYKTFKSLLDFYSLHQIILIIPEKTRLFINPLVNRLGFILNAATPRTNKFVIVEKKYYLLIDI